MLIWLLMSLSQIWIESHVTPIELMIDKRYRPCHFNCLSNYMLWIAVFETDRSTLAELQYRLLIFASDAVSSKLVILTMGDGLVQIQIVWGDGDLLDVGQHEASLAGQSYWHRIWAASEITKRRGKKYLLIVFKSIKKCFSEFLLW